MPEIIGTSKSISGFDPRSIPGCLMWLEPTQFTGTGSSTVWADLSGNGYNMSYNASYTSPPTLNTTTPINGNNTVSFTGTTGCRLTGSITFPNSERSIFIVLRPTGMSSSVAADISLLGPVGASGYLSMSLQPYTGTTPYYWFLTNTGSYFTMATQSATLPTVNNVCMLAAVNATSTASNVMTLNGITQTLDTANNVASFPGGAYTQYLGGGASGTKGNWDCCEMIFYSTAITPTQRQQVEGYLAWKWGIEYIPQATTSTGALPTTISGLSLWLDGSDPAGTGVAPADGSTISTWVDKSGNGYNATVASGRIGGQYSAAYKSAYFQASNVGYATSYPANPTNETMFIVANINSPASINNNTIIGGQLGARSFGFGYSGGGGTGTSSYLNNEVAWQSGGQVTTSTGTTTMITGTVSGTTSVTLSKNAGATVSGSISAWYSGTTTYLGVDTTTTAYYYIGYIMEIIFYNSVLTTAQKQKIEAYLIGKWGIGAYTVDYTPIISGPSSIPGCIIWCDASANNSLANLSTAGTYTTTTTGQTNIGGKSGLNTVTLTTSQTWTTSPTVTLSAYTMFWVGRQTGGTNARVLQSTTNSQLYGYWAGYKYSLYIDGSPGWLAESNSDTNWDMFSHSRTAGGSYTFDWNGTFRRSSTSSTSNNLTGLAINTGANPSEVSACEIGEIILYNWVLNATQIKSIERYLSLKWGLSNYYTSIPGSVPGLMVWLDGGDSSTMTFPSGSNISGWRDKAALGMTLSNTYTGAYPTLTSNGIFCSNVGSSPTSSSQGLRYDGNWIASVPTMAMTGFVSYTALCNDSYRNAVFIAGTNGGSYATRPNFIMSFENGNSGYSINLIQLDNSSSWAQLVFANTNTSLGPRIDSIVSTPGATSGWIFSNGIEMTYSNSNSYTSTYSNYTPNLLYMGAYTSTVQGGRCFHGYINEILFYSNALSSTQRSVVQSYLARKWSNTTVPTEVLPLTHPFTQIRPSLRAFVPTDISGCKVWLDSSDSNSLRLSSGNLSTWGDKSGNGNNATSAGSAITLSSAGAYFGGSSYMTINSFADGLVSTPFVIFIVETLAGSGYYFGSDDYSGATDAALHTGYRSATNHTFAFWGDDLEDTTVSGTGNKRIWSMWLPSGANRNTRRNGATDVTHGNSNYLTQFLSPRIGRVFGGNWYTGTISEIIIYTGALSLRDVQQVEGYLGWKWNIPLASAHPFYKFPSSTVLPWQPTSISNCFLWLDGADTRSMTISNSNVLAWRDKSGNKFCALSQSTPATLTSNSLGGNTSMLFNGASKYLCSTTSVSNAGYTIFTVQNTTSASGYQRAINADPYAFIGVSNGYIATFTGSSTWNDVASNSPSFYSVNSNVIVSMSISNAVLTPYTNGYAGTTKTGTTGAFSNFYIGDYASGGQPWYGHIREIIVYNGILSTDQRQQVEGYLAWKWNLVSNLTSVMTQGLAYHLDAGNTASYPGSGSTWTDLVGTGVAMTLYNSPSFSTTVGGSIAFTPSSSHYAATATEFQSAAYTNWTIEVWMSPTNTYTGTNPAILTQKYPSTINYMLGVTAGATAPNVGVGFFNGAWYYIPTGYAATANVWAQFVGTYDGANLKLHVNGILVQSNATTATATWANSGGIYLMRRWDGAEYFGGSLAIVRIYNRALSLSEINRNFNAQRARFSI